MADLTLKQHDLWPPLHGVLSDANGPIDLTSAAQVKLLMKQGSTLVSGLCELDTNPVTGVPMDRTLGEVYYVWVAGDTDQAADYEVEFEITWPGTKAETVPNAGYNSVEIQADLG